MSDAAGLPKSGVLQELGPDTMHTVTCGCGRVNWTACRRLVASCVSNITDKTTLALMLLIHITNFLQAICFE